MVKAFLVPAICALVFLSCAKKQDPKLVLVIVVDQMREDFFQKFGHTFGKNGINRLLKNGIRFRNHLIPYINTETGAGHAVLLSGLLPKTSGIVSNKWYEPGTEHSISCIQGIARDSVFYAGGRKQSSPRLFRGHMIGDFLKEKNPEAKVFSVAVKDRSAILLGGKKADAAYWPDKDYRMVSSAYYLPGLPEWVNTWNRANAVDRRYKRVWRPFRDTALYRKAEMPADNPWVAGRAWSGPFPHTISHSLFGESVFQMERMLSFVKELILQEDVGGDHHPDILAWSISIPDYTGHRYGMESRELMDVYARVDSLIENLLDYVDRKAGKGQYSVFLTSDHGIRKTVELAVSKGNPEALRIDKSAITRAFIDSLRKEYAITRDKAVNADFRLVRIRSNSVYFNRELADSLGLPFQDIKARCQAYLKGVPGIRKVFDINSLEGGDLFLKAARNNFFPGRMGELLIDLDPDANFKVSLGMHGYFGTDCQHIPLIAVIPGRVQGVVERYTSIADLAPSIARMLGVPVTDRMDGSVLEELFEPQNIQ
ncbi:alkaline phosphatase family protein [Fibrobacterota bacterium]